MVFKCKTITDSLPFHYVIVSEYGLSKSSGEPSLHPVSIYMKFHWWCSNVQFFSVACAKRNGVLVLLKKFWLKIIWWSFCILYFHWPAIEEKCWVSVEHKLQLLSILSVNTSGWHYTFLENELKDTQKQLTENIWTWNYSSIHLPIEICSSFLNNLIIIGNFRKHLT